MKCREHRDWMSLYIDNMLNDEELEIFKEHIQKCTSCQEELTILQQLMGDINTLEVLEPPENFHKELMQRIQLEPSIKETESVYTLNNHKKWSSKWKLVSGIAAAFLIAFIATDGLRFEFLSKRKSNTGNVQMKTIALEESAPQVAADVADTQPEMRAFSMEVPRLDTLEIQTEDYEKCKEIINKINMDMTLEEELVQEVIIDGSTNRQLTMEVTLLKNEKDELVSRIREFYPNVTMDFQNDDEDLSVREDVSNITLVIIVTETK